jgi:hypothetical protein
LELRKLDQERFQMTGRLSQTQESYFSAAGGLPGMRDHAWSVGASASLQSNDLFSNLNIQFTIQDEEELVFDVVHVKRRARARYGRNLKQCEISAGILA